MAKKPRRKLAPPPPRAPGPIDPLDVHRRDVYATLCAAARESTRTDLAGVFWDVSRPLAQAFPPPLETAGCASTPDGMLLELSVVARPFDQDDGVPLWKQYRDVYLHERDPKDSAARSFFMAHTRCPLSTVKRLVLWAEMLHVPIVYDPPDNLSHGWNPPAENPPRKPVKPKSAFDSVL